MKQLQRKLVFVTKSWRIRTKDQLSYLYKQILMLIMVICIPFSATASVNCRGHFVNPITDICWSCILPISIGGYSIGKGAMPKKRDTKNPSSPVCMCTKGDVPVPGVSIGFWEPVRLIDVTRTPYCMTNLGGLQLGKGGAHRGGYNRSYYKRGAHNSFYHLHYYVYPLIYWLELITDFVCLEENQFDVAYMSEFDISWNDSKMQNLLNPESIIFGNIFAQGSCALDCVASSFAMPIDNMFWCAGCLGNMYPLSGVDADHIGGVRTGNLLATRILNKMHRVGLAQETSTNDGSINGKLCRKHRSLRLKKSQYKLQMVNPRTSSKGLGCWPLGLSDMAYSSGNEYPHDGEDWGYLVFRKRNCCLF